MDKLVELKEKQVYIDGVLVYSFNDKIEKHIFMGSRVIVLLEFSENKTPNNENVFCFNVDNKKKEWQVEKVVEHNEICPFTSIYIENNKLMGYKRCGIDCEIDLKTGKIISSELIK